MVCVWINTSSHRYRQSKCKLERMHTHPWFWKPVCLPQIGLSSSAPSCPQRLPGSQRSPDHRQLPSGPEHGVCMAMAVNGRGMGKAASAQQSWSSKFNDMRSRISSQHPCRHSPHAWQHRQPCPPRSSPARLMRADGRARASRPWGFRPPEWGAAPHRTAGGKVDGAQRNCIAVLLAQDVAC